MGKEYDMSYTFPVRLLRGGWFYGLLAAAGIMIAVCTSSGNTQSTGGTGTTGGSGTGTYGTDTTYGGTGTRSGGTGTDTSFGTSGRTGQSMDTSTGTGGGWNHQGTTDTGTGGGMYNRTDTSTGNTGTGGVKNDTGSSSSSGMRREGEMENEGGAGSMSMNAEAVSINDNSIDMPAQIPSGTVTFKVTNKGNFEHSFAIEGNGTKRKLDESLKPGETRTFQLDLQPGSYTIYDPVGTNKDQGVSANVTVGEQQQH